MLDLHAEALTLGGSTGVRSVHLLLSAIGQVEQTVFGEDAYPTVPEKAAAWIKGQFFDWVRERTRTRDRGD